MILLLLQPTVMKYAVYFIILFSIMKTLSFIYKNFIRKRKNLKEIYGTNTWALVTGATDGLGKAYCEELASEGFNIILVSRTQKKLDIVESELKNKYKNIQTKTIEFDFSIKTKLEDYINIFGELQNNLEVSILVNNVGIKFEGYYSEQSLEQIGSYIDVNMLSQTMLTKLFMKNFVDRKKRSAIIDLSSYIHKYPCSILTMYSSSKAYNSMLTNTLAHENFTNIDFLSVQPMIAVTPGNNVVKGGLFVITPQQSVIGTLNQLGYETNTSGHWLHNLQYFFASKMPQAITNYAVKRFYDKLNKK